MKIDFFLKFYSWMKILGKSAAQNSEYKKIIPYFTLSGAKNGKIGNFTVLNNILKNQLLKNNHCRTSHSFWCDDTKIYCGEEMKCFPQFSFPSQFLHPLLLDINSRAGQKCSWFLVEIKNRKIRIVCNYAKKCGPHNFPESCKNMRSMWAKHGENMRKICGKMRKMRGNVGKCDSADIRGKNANRIISRLQKSTKTDHHLMESGPKLRTWVKHILKYANGGNT